MITFPILIYEPNDLCVFESLDYATSYIEAIDVIDEIYTAYDGAGRLLKLSVKAVGRRQLVEIEAAETEPGHQEELKQVLITFFRAVGAEKEWLANASLENLVYKAREYMIPQANSHQSNLWAPLATIAFIAVLTVLLCLLFHFVHL